jgi:cytochrome c-type biogenesis protein CcmH
MAAHAAPPGTQAELEARMLALTAQMRCLVCQNDSVAHSNAPLAADLRRDVLERLSRGESEAQVVEALRQRYGDALLYRPPLTRSTALLWFGPALLLLAAVAALAWVLRERKRHPPPDL